jgi:hypothetical protein
VGQENDRPAEKRKVGSSILPLTTHHQACYRHSHLRIQQRRGILVALSALIVKFSDLRKRSGADACATAEPQEERKTMATSSSRPRQRKPLDAGPLAPEIGSFRLHLAAEGKAAKTVRTYTEAVAWFAAAPLIRGPAAPGGSRSAATTCSGGWSTC